MNFRTQIPINKSDFSIDYHSKLLFLGSCFSENIGHKFQYYKFKASVNPFGIIFNSVSLEKLIKRVVYKNYFSDKDIFFHNDLWHCYEVHSELSSPNKNEFLNNLNSFIDLTNQQITELTHCFITLGTSWVYRNIESNEIVANCHKVPQKEFTKELLSKEENEKSLKNIISLIHSVNPNVNFIFTVSPVRHIKDGFFENNVSKGNLISSTYKIVNYHLSIANYFPSYEIVMDELRDYRFFEKDMLHPNQLAIDYIWEKLSYAFFSNKTIEINKEVDVIQKALAHKPFNADSNAHLKFVNQLQSRINELQEKYHFLNFS